jgi:hypothetical protein
MYELFGFLGLIPACIHAVEGGASGEDATVCREKQPYVIRSAKRDVNEQPGGQYEQLGFHGRIPWRRAPSFLIPQAHRQIS